MNYKMNAFLQRCVINFICLISVFLLITGDALSESSKEVLPFCGLAKSSSRYIFVSTLDGKLTALNPNNEGSVLWTVHPGSETMLSSSIHKLELSNYGHLVRMIPSLSGGLYKFNGENIEVIPVTTDHLLQSSFKYSDDLVISGGKETRTYGVSLRSGQMIYECSMKGCGNVSHSTDNGEILVIQRLGQIVRAVEPRTGTEKWNFSVAQHNLKILSDCHSEPSSELDYKLHVVIPEGVIYATDVKDSSRVIWKQKFKSPVAGAWQLHRGELVELDLFSNFQSSVFNSVTPSIYIGMHDKQLYIQESVVMLNRRQEIASQVKQKLIGGEKNYLRIPWKPVLASSTSLGVAGQKVMDEHTLDDASQRQTTALSVLYASPYVNGNGFYLYTDYDLENVKKGSCDVSADDAASKKIQKCDSDHCSLAEFVFDSNFVADFSEASAPVKTVITSVWYYWKEILVISITTTFLFNVFIREYFKWKSKASYEISENTNSSGKVKENNSGVDLSVDLSTKRPEKNGIQEYVSRYLTDFEPVNCLGKGGFGVVFEAKNKIDDCHYAIKRILLPSKQESRDRVLREVKALAKLDHHHIVRYFNAWTECPPPGWQESHDGQWLDKNSDLFTSNEVTSADSMTTTSDTNNKSSLSNVNSFYPSSVSYSSTCRTPSLSGELNYVKDEISDSFIVFDESDQNSKSVDSNEPKRLTSAKFEKDQSFMSVSQISSKSKRPTSLLLTEKTCSDFQNLNKVYLYIQMQLCQRQSLKDWLLNNKKRDYDHVLNIFEQILQAVEHVHLHGLIHRDLKPSNIFFSLDNQIKVGDFGLVTAMTEGDVPVSPIEGITVNVQNERHTAQVGTQLYMSHEQLLGKPYSYKVDIYSLGLILFELLVPFSTQMERVHVLQDIKNDRFPKNFIEKYKNEYDLLRLMLSHSPDKRPTTFGIRARLPLRQESSEEDWHFELPMRKRASSKTSHNSSSSTEGSADLR